MKIIDDENKNVETPNMNIFDHSSTVTMPRVLLQSSSLLNDDLFISSSSNEGKEEDQGIKSNVKEGEATPMDTSA